MFVVQKNNVQILPHRDRSGSIATPATRTFVLGDKRSNSSTTKSKKSRHQVSIRWLSGRFVPGTTGVVDELRVPFSDSLDVQGDWST